jgi:GMP synthase (glutamine-hydrolysing)
MSANDDNDAIKYETDWISVALESEKPFLGICLGGQMLANNLGGSGAESWRWVT